MERIDLDGEQFTERRDDQVVWRNGDPWADSTTTVIVGELPDSGRWYARWFGRGPLRPGACAYSGVGARKLAERTARSWMRSVGGEWVEA